MKLRFMSMTAALAIGISAAVAIACGLGAYVYSIHHFKSLIENARRTALAESEMIRSALEHQMIENDRSLIGQMIDAFGKEPNVEAVVLLDRTGQARYSSVPLTAGNDLTIGSPTCQSCHQFAPEERMSSRVIETRGGTILRTVVPVRNRQPCYGCHDPNHKINGVLIVDVNAGEIRAATNRDLRWMAAGSGALMLLLVAAIGVVVRIVVVRRLQRFETTARMIAAGDLDRRVPADGSDTVAWLAREFNAMADTMSGLLGEVRGQRERLETIINSIDDGIVVLDAERKVIAANDAFLRRSGRERAGLLGMACHDTTSKTCGSEDCPTLATLATGERQVRICERMLRPGISRWEEVHSSPIMGASGEVIQVVEVWRDISERRAAEAQMAESHRLASLGLLASGFSHELNTPLATVLACVEGILRSERVTPDADKAEWDRIEEHARIAREQILRCRGITQHFLQLSSGKPSQTSLVDLQATFAAVVPLVAPMAKSAGVTIEADPAPADARVRVNDAELQQVLLNLLLNAIQACGPQGRVRLSAGAGDPVRIVVSDDGCGIAPENLKRIFEPFFSLRDRGTGLGLFLSMNFVRRWGGDLVVESVPGEGARFEIVLPGLCPPPRNQEGTS